MDAEFELAIKKINSLLYHTKFMIDTVPLPERPSRRKRNKRRTTGIRAIGTWPTPERKALKKKFSKALVTYRKASTDLKSASLSVVELDRGTRLQLRRFAAELRNCPIVKYSPDRKICIRRSLFPCRYNCYDL